MYSLKCVVTAALSSRWFAWFSSVFSEKIPSEILCLCLRFQEQYGWYFFLPTANSHEDLNLVSYYSRRQF